MKAKQGTLLAIQISCSGPNLLNTSSKSRLLAALSRSATCSLTPSCSSDRDRDRGLPVRERVRARDGEKESDLECVMLPDLSIALEPGPATAGTGLSPGRGIPSSDRLLLSFPLKSNLPKLWALFSELDR